MFFCLLLRYSLALSLLHPMKMSVCEIVYAPQRQVFDVKCYLYQDDLRDVIYNNPMEGALDQAHVEPYLRQHLQIKINQQPCNLVWQSVKERKDQVLVHFTIEAPAATPIKQVFISNNIMFEKFGNQINMLHLYYPDSNTKRVKICSISQALATFDF
jgi:hypothetical protein